MSIRPSKEPPPLEFRWVVVAAVALALAASGAELDFAPLEKFAVEQLAATGTPGLAIAVVVDGKVAYRKALGIAHVETGAPVTADMLFRLGSTTKMFTAATLLILAEQGKVDLQRPIGGYMKGLSPKISALTAHQLLSHTAGLRNYGSMSGPQDDGELSKRVRGLRDSAVVLEPGAIISYSNTGYWIAGALIEEITGKRYADAVRDLVFAPLGMTRSTFRPLVAFTYPFATGHFVGSDGKPAVVRPFVDDASTWPSGSLFSNVDELARFAIAFMSGGRSEGRQAVPRAAIERMSRTEAPVPGGQFSYGYGLALNTASGVRFVGHGGARSGYGSTLTMAPERKFAVIVVANRTSSSMQQVADKAVEIALGIKDDSPPEPTPIAMTAGETARYAGVFEDPDLKIELIARGANLVLIHNGKESPVVKVGEDHFRVAGAVVPEFYLVKDKSGKYEYLHASLMSLRRART